MKRLLMIGFGASLLAIGGAHAQKGYVDDIYYNGDQAKKDAQEQAKHQKNNAGRQEANDQSNYGNYDDNYAQYDGGYYDDDSYIDYDDDSYTSRIRRFYYPMSGVGYWGSVYSPFWASPFYFNPYYGWGGWYNPGFGFSIGMSWGGGPYWSNGWGMSTWFGYGGFSSWYMPYGGYYGGWGGGYWNGYYAGMNDAHHGWNRPSVNYGPRGNRNGMMSVGSYGTNSRMQPVGRDRMMQPMNGRRSDGNVIQRSGEGRTDLYNSRGQQMQQQNGRRGDVIRFDDRNGERSIEMNRNAAGRNNGQVIEPTDRNPRVINGGDNSGQRFNVERSTPQPNRGNVERSAPSRNYTPSVQPSRGSSGGGSPMRGGGGGGGSRSGTGGRR